MRDILQSQQVNKLNKLSFNIDKKINHIKFTLILLLSVLDSISVEMPVYTMSYFVPISRDGSSLQSPLCNIPVCFFFKH